MTLAISAECIPKAQPAVAVPATPVATVDVATLAELGKAGQAITDKAISLIDMLARLGVHVRFVLTPSRRRVA